MREEEEYEVGRVAGVESINPSLLSSYQRHPTAFPLCSVILCNTCHIASFCNAIITRTFCSYQMHFVYYSPVFCITLNHKVLAVQTIEGNSVVKHHLMHLIPLQCLCITVKWALWFIPWYCCSIRHTLLHSVLFEAEWIVIVGVRYQRHPRPPICNWFNETD